LYYYSLYLFLLRQGRVIIICYVMSISCTYICITDGSANFGIYHSMVFHWRFAVVLKFLMLNYMHISNIKIRENNWNFEVQRHTVDKAPDSKWVNREFKPH